MNQKTFITDNLALAPYLLNQGLKFLHAEYGYGKNNKRRIIFVFEDAQGVGRELERSFLNSPEKRYKDSLHYFRNQIKLCQDKFNKHKE